MDIKGRRFFLGLYRSTFPLETGSRPDPNLHDTNMTPLPQTESHLGQDAETQGAVVDQARLKGESFDPRCFLPRQRRQQQRQSSETAAKKTSLSEPLAAGGRVRRQMARDGR